MDHAALSAHLARLDTVLEGPSSGSAGSVPLGNGDLAANVWCESAALGIHLAVSEAWDAHGRLPKVGRLELRWEGSPFAQVKHALRLERAEFEAAGGGVQVTVRVHADARVLEITGEGPAPAVRLHPWRATPRKLDPKEMHGIDTWLEPVAGADEPLDLGGEAIGWWRCNRTSIWGPVLRHEGMGAWADSHEDPLLHHAVAGVVWGEGFTRKDGWLRRSGSGRWRLLVAVVSGRFPTAAACAAALTAARAAATSRPAAVAIEAHRAWWTDFWRRSWIRIDWTQAPQGKEWGFVVERAWALQRFVTACAGRGVFPIKFNGSLFTMDLPKGLLATGRATDEPDADCRAWGGCYWFQNTRLPYWPMLASGDQEQMAALFAMYRDMLPYAEARTRTWFGHGGAFFPETLYFFGAYRSYDYGLDRAGKPVNQPDSVWVGRYWCGILELLGMGLDRFDFAGDRAWLAETLLPVARAALQFYAEHYPRRGGRLHLAPAQSLETYQVDTEDPLPEVAGLRYVLPRLIACPDPAVSTVDRAAWQALLDATPPLPLGKDQHGDRLLPAAVYPRDKLENLENPELYAVFPHRLYAVGSPGLATGRRTYDARIYQDGGFGWRQDPIQAAYLGMDEHAWWLTRRNAQCQHGEEQHIQGKVRFPAFWGPNFDWLPDQDHGGVTQMATQAMLLQWDGRRIFLLPAWPRRINVSFRLHAPFGTVIECELKDGLIKRLEVTPRERAADVEFQA